MHYNRNLLLNEDAFCGPPFAITTWMHTHKIVDEKNGAWVEHEDQGGDF